MSDPPSSKRPDQPSPPPDSENNFLAVQTELGLTRAQLDKLIKVMSAVVWRVGCHEHVHRLDVVNDAFVLALCKPILERPPVTDQKRFGAWMCTLAELAALSSLKSKHRRLLGDEPSESEIAELLSTPGHAKYAGMRGALQKALKSLEPDDQALLAALYFEGKTITEIAAEQKEPRSTVDSRHRRVLALLRAALQSTIAVIILFFTKNARAQGVRLGAQVARLLPHATQTACAMTVTAACGVMVPASSLATAVHQEVTTSVGLPPPNSTMAAAVAPKEPPLATEVEPVKPTTIDMLVQQCSASGMNSTKLASYLVGTMLPFAFLALPVATNVGCAGSERQKAPVQEPEERDDSQDPYEAMCESQHHLGVECPTKEAWYRKLGLCPDGTEGCQK